MMNRMVPGNKTENYQKALKMAAKSKDGRQNIQCHFDFVAFDIIAIKYNVIPHFRLIWVQYADYVEITIFTFQGHAEVKTANVRHQNHRYL